MSLQITISEYINELNMSGTKRIIVEGPDDKIVIEKLLFHYLKTHNTGQKVSDFSIDTAERLRDSSFYNKKIILEIFHRISDKPLAAKLVGLIDREFDGFEINPDLRDELGCHRSEGNLIWTRGHSIENYFFDLGVLQATILALSSTDNTHALELLHTHLIEVLKIACAISLTAAHIGRHYKIEGIYNRIASSFSDELIVIDDEVVYLDTVTWQTELERRLNSVEIASEFVSTLSTQVQRLNGKDTDTIRWISHGHITMYFLSSFYNACIARAYGSSTKNQRDLLSPRSKLATLANSWAIAALTDDVEYPRELLDKLT